MYRGKNKKKKKIPQPDMYRKCFVCGEQYGDQNLDTHMHSYIHHEAIEHLKGSEQLHKCWACDVSMMGLEQYKEHIATRKHVYSLYKLHKKRKKQKGLQVNYNIDLTEEFITLQTERQKMEGPKTENCFVCLHKFPVQDLDVHMHSIVHHQAVEQLKGSPQVHKCWACDMSKTGMAEFKVHIGTLHHKYMLFKLRKITADGKTVDYSAEIDDELRALCVQRDQQNKKKTRERKKMKKTKRQKALLNQTENTKSIQLNQSLPKRRQESILDMGRSNGPLVKRPCLEKPSKNLPQEMSARCITTPKTKDDTGGSTCGPGLVQNRMEANKPKLTPLQKQTHSKRSTWKVNRAASQSQHGATREGMNGQEPNIDSLPSGISLAEIFESQASGNDCQAVEFDENVQPHTVCVKKKKSNEHETEQGETSLEHHNSFETNSCNVCKNKRKKQDISHNNRNPKTNDKISRKRKVNMLMTLSSKEDELTSSLEIVGDELFQAYSTLQSAYTEVQRLLAVKQQVTSEMASLREKRIMILHDMKNPSRCSTHSDQQVGLNDS